MRTIIYRGLRPVTLQQFLQQQFPLLTTGQCNKFLRENKIKLNGKKQPLTTALRPHDEIKVFIQEEFLQVPTEENRYQFAGNLDNIVFEDDNLLVADKPAGLSVSDEDGAARDTLLLRAKKYLISKGSNAEPRLCHRLDTGTSGLVLIAKTEKAEKFLTQLIREHKIRKEYVCVTFGRPQPAASVLRGYHVKDASAGRVYIQKNSAPDAKKVETRYETMAVSGRLALLKVEIITGRTHQIRAHLADIGCPILGDSKYGNNAANRELKLKYQALCARRLTFPEIEGQFESWSGMKLNAQKPWYFDQILDGTLK